jgi:two-component system, sensor histidine kinase and response regulator
VDDRLENRLLLREWLTAVGFTVHEAHNGRQAVEIWQDWRPHLILMDMRMPEMDGYEASRLIKSSMAGQETIIIALTASMAETERALVLSSGCDDMVRKPVREAIILEKLAEHLDVQYLYASAMLPTGTMGGNTAVSTLYLDQQLQQLHQQQPESLASLRSSANALDMEGSYTIINQQIRPHFPLLAQHLQELVDNFRFDALQTLLHKVPAL